MAMAIVGTIMAITANIMSTDDVLGIRRIAFSIGISAVSFLVGASLISFAVPRIAAYRIILPFESRIAPALRQGEMLAPDIVSESISAYARAEDWLPEDADIQQTLARIYLRRAGNAQAESAARQAALENALERIDHALSAAPNRHFSWALRADILMLLGRPISDVEAAIHMSFLLGPYEASSMLLRTRIIMSRWNQVSSDTRRIAEGDLRGQWQCRQLRRRLVEFYLRQPLSSRVLIRRAALHSEKDVRLFDKILKRAAN